ncbi:MAG: flippase [Desulfuromonadaceae bacterium]|nr:flippase [Desulfuromonadaceae bacterium]
MNNQGWLKLLPLPLRRRIEGHYTLQKMVSNTGWMFFDRLLRMGAGLFIGVWVARYLGPGGYGLLSFAGSYVMMFSAIALFGLESLVVRELVTYPDQRPAILGTAFVIRLAAGLVAVPLALGTLTLIRPDDRITLILVSLLSSSLVFQAVEVVDLWFQSQIATRCVAIVRMVSFSLSSLGKMVCVMSGASITAIAWVTATEALMVGCGLLLAYRLSGEQMTTWKFSRNRFRSMLSGAFPMLLSGIVFMVYLRIDQVMLGAMVSASELGQYAAAVRISEVWYFVPAAIITAVFPRIVTLKASNPESFNAKLQQLYNLLVFLGYLVALPATLLAPWIVQLLFGSAYQPAAPLLAVLIWAGVFANLTVVRNAHFIALDWGKAMLLCTTAGAATNVLLNLVLIPRWGAMGAAAATCISYWVAAHGACLCSRSLWPAAGMITRALVYPRWW